MQTELTARGAAILAAVVLVIIGGLFALQPAELVANGLLVVDEPCAGFEQPATVELRISDDDSRYGYLTHWQTFMGGPTTCSAGFAFGELPDVSRYEVRAGSYSGSFTRPRADMVVNLNWTLEGGIYGKSTTAEAAHAPRGHDRDRNDGRGAPPHGDFVDQPIRDVP